MLDAKQFFESIGVAENLQNPALVESVNKLIEQTINERLAEQKKMFEQKESVLAEEVQAIKDELAKKESIMNEELSSFAESLNKKNSEEMQMKESILLEETANYDRYVESTIKEEAQAYREGLQATLMEEAKALMAEKDKELAIKESIMMEAIEEYQKSLNATLEEEVGVHIESQNKQLREEVNEIKANLVEDIGQYLSEKVVAEMLPKNLYESAAKASAMEHIVEGVSQLFGKHGIKLDGKTTNLLQESAKKNENLSLSLKAKEKDMVNAEGRIKDLEKKAKLFELTEGLTVVQRKTAVKLLENYKADELESKYKLIESIIMNGGISSTPKVVPSQITKATSNAQLNESVKKKLEQIEKEDVLDANKQKRNTPESEIDEWARTLKKDRLN